MMARPEWDIALICEKSGLTPSDIGNLFRDRDGNKMRCISENELPISRVQWESILVTAQGSGAVTEIMDVTKPPEERIWKVSHGALEILTHDVNLILDVLPAAKKRFSSNNSYRIAATIPEELPELSGFFRAFENTALGLRRMITQASSKLIILVPFMDSEGLSEIQPSLERALERGVSLQILTRKLGKEGRNMLVLSNLVCTAKKNRWDLQLFEAVLSNNSPISHAKVFSRDGGDEVYIGSANLTVASMEKTIEIGVFLKGEQTQQLNEFLATVKSLSQRRYL